MEKNNLWKSLKKIHSDHDTAIDVILYDFFLFRNWIKNLT